MTVEDIKDILVYGGGGIFLLMTIIQIVPIKLDPWSWVARCIGRAINANIIAKVDTLSTDVNALRFECNEREANLCRSHILRFGDELLHGVSHSQEHFLQILIDIDTYEKYCDEHDEYVNNVANATIKQIKKTYQDCLDTGNFL